MICSRAWFSARSDCNPDFLIVTRAKSRLINHRGANSIVRWCIAMVGQSEIRKSIDRGTRTGQQDLFQFWARRLVSPGGVAAARSASPRTPGFSPPSLSSRGTATLDTDAIAAAMAGTGCNGDRSAAGTVQPETCVSDYQGTGTSYRSTPSYSRSPGHDRLSYQMACLRRLSYQN